MSGSAWNHNGWPVVECGPVEPPANSLSTGVECRPYLCCPIEEQRPLGPLAIHPATGHTLVDENTDHALVERARAGDHAAFRKIVERHEGAIGAVVVGMLGPGPEAEDVGQDTFIRFYRSLDRFRGDAALRTYLTRIAKNLSLNALKRRKRTSLRFLRIDDGSSPEVRFETLASEEASPAADVERRERERAVRSAIDGIDEKHRVVLVLRMIEGLSTRETAEALGLPQGTVLSRLSRAMKKLELELAEWINKHD